MGRGSMLPGSGSQPDTRLAREPQGLSTGRAGEQVCRVTQLLSGEAHQATFRPAPTCLGPLPFYLLPKKEFYKVSGSTYPSSPSSPSSHPWQPLLHCDWGARPASQVGPWEPTSGPETLPQGTASTGTKESRLPAGHLAQHPFPEFGPYLGANRPATPGDRIRRTPL